ncbi:hypothetical protein HBB16_19135 [Pseudonocardia sp. MCCB 268]|nr:hypothetical protein [Pseudonocardia cytotoxica]
MLRSVSGSWALGTAVPVAGVMLAGLVTLVHGDASPAAGSVTMLALGGTAIGTRPAHHGRGRPRHRRPGADGAPGTGPGEYRTATSTCATPSTRQHRAQTATGQPGRGMMRAAGAGTDRDLFGRHVDATSPRIRRRYARTRIRLGGGAARSPLLFVGSRRVDSNGGAPSQRKVVTVLSRFFSMVVECLECAAGGSTSSRVTPRYASSAPAGPRRLAPGAALAAARGLGLSASRQIPGQRPGSASRPGTPSQTQRRRPAPVRVHGDQEDPVVGKAARLTELAKSVPGG